MDAVLPMSVTPKPAGGHAADVIIDQTRGETFLPRRAAATAATTPPEVPP